MSRVWNLIKTLYLEAKTAATYRDQLFRYAMAMYGEHQTDELRASMQRLPAPEFQKYVMRTFADPRMDHIVSSMFSAALTQHPQGQKRGIEPSYPTKSTSNDKGSGNAEPIPARPDRADPLDSPLYGKPRLAMSPGSSYTHDVGSAGQNQPHQQPSVQSKVRPSVVSTLDKDNGVPRSGLVAAQKAVDELTKSGQIQKSNALAKKLGVPTSAERTVVDDSGKKKIMVWSPDRVLRHRDPDVEEPKELDTGDEPVSRLDLIKHGLIKRNAAGEHKPSFPGTVVGQRWAPHGRAKWQRTSRPDMATGNFAYGMSLVDPSKTGKEMVWDGSQWLPSDEFEKIFGSMDSKSVAARAVQGRIQRRMAHRKRQAQMQQADDERAAKKAPKPAPPPKDDFDDDEKTDPDVKG